ncbi:MAG: hypothetical protein WBB45_07780 [Cyclobacteriaceae bacterium]
MAIIKDNVWVEGASGGARKGSIVYRQRAGATIVGGRPSPSSTPATESQLAHRERFNMATVYAKLALQSEQLGPQYREAASGRVSAYNVAVRDKMTPPSIDGVMMDDYTGAAGSRIYVVAHDDFALKSVTVSIQNQFGAVQQEGEATIAEDRGAYVYELTADVTGTGLVVVKIIAEDLAGNQTEYQVEVSAETGL